jgi:GTP-binding protein
MGDQVTIVQRNGLKHSSTVKELYTFEGLGKEKTKDAVGSGEIVAVLGLEDFDIGDTIADPETPEALPPISIDEPSMSMLFTINTSPFFGKEGKFVTSRHLRERLLKETEKNLALRVEDTDSPDRLRVYGRGILHLSILIETMRREGYELQLGQPQVVIKEIDGFRHEPVELLYINVDEEFSGKVIEIVTGRKGDILNIEKKEDRVYLEFKITARGLIGLRQQGHRDCYRPQRGHTEHREKGRPGISGIQDNRQGAHWPETTHPDSHRGKCSHFPQVCRL